MLSSSPPRSFDIVILADMSRAGDIGLRIRRDVQTFHGFGYSIGLRHLAPSNRNAQVLPDIRRTVRDGLAEIVPAGVKVVAKLAVVHSPRAIKAPVADLAHYEIGRVVMVHDSAPNLEQMGAWFSFNFGEMSWAPTNRWVRAKLTELGFPVPLEPEDWRPIGLPVAASIPRPRSRARPVFGRVSAPGASQWPKTVTALETVYPTDLAIDFRMMGPPPSDLLKELKAARHWAGQGFDDIAVERFLEMLDVFIYYPGAQTPELPDAAISTAMASGKIVVLPPHLQPHFGPGPLYLEADEALAGVTALLEDDDALSRIRAEAQSSVALRFGEEAHATRLTRLIGPPDKPRKSTRGRRARRSNKPRALMIPSNGIGLGHVTRLLAISRRLHDEVEPVFISLAQANSIIRSFGYHAEYIPSHKSMGISLADWDEWFGFELENAIERHRPDVVVFDGNNPTNGLLDAVLSRGDTRLVWVRRAMGQERPSAYVENTRFFDSVIEPGELAAEYDTGPTANRRNEVDEVPPIRLLDREDLVARKAAREKLGLIPDDPAVLIQLGAGTNRDLPELIERIIWKLRRFDRLQIVVAEWGNSNAPLPHFPGTRILRGFPNALYFNAFDFSIAAAGYNAFHELLGSGLPSIFIADRHPSMDDQGARAAYAQNHGIGFDLQDDEMHLLPTLVEALLTEQVSTFMRNKCLEMDQSNGAGMAADIIKRMAGVA